MILNSAGLAWHVIDRVQAESMRNPSDRLTHFGTATDVTIAELRLEAFLPVDETTSAALTELVGQHQPPSAHA